MSEHPLAEAPADSAEVVTERLAVALARERREQVRGRTDEPIPDVEDGLDLALHDVVGETQVLDVLVVEQDTFLHQLEIGERHRRVCDRARAVRVNKPMKLTVVFGVRSLSASR
jgi:hypothetical protein